jgi:hypothetical protein
MVYELEIIDYFSPLSVKKDKFLLLSVARQRSVNHAFMKGLDINSMRGAAYAGGGT